MPMIVNSWLNLAASPTNVVLMSGEWSSGEARGVRDVTTGDLIAIFGDYDNNNTFRLVKSQDHGATWSLVATDVSNPDTGGGSQYPNRVLGITQDASGAVHALTAGKGGDDRFFVVRFTLTRSGGHVTGFSIAQAPIALPDHNRTLSSDLRGDIKVVPLNGVERIVWAYPTNFTSGTNTDLYVYAGHSTTLTYSSSSDFVALNGSAGDTLVHQVTGSDIETQHYSEALITYDPSNEDLIIAVGRLNSDHRVAVASDAAYNLEYHRYTSSGGNYTYDQQYTLATDNGVAPQLLSVAQSAIGAVIMYYHPTQGIRFAKVSGGTLTDGFVSSPLSTGNRSAFGVCSVNDAGEIWTIFHTFGDNSDQQRQGRFAHWDGTAWDSVTDNATSDCNGFSAIQWHYGVAAVRYDGALLPQSQTALRVATVWNTQYSVEAGTFRFGDDTGNETAHGWLAAENTNITRALGSASLFRQIVNVLSGTPGAVTPSLWVKRNGGTTRKLAVSSAAPTLSYGAAGALAYSANNGTLVSPAYPSGITQQSALVLVVGQKPSTANGGTITTPSGWTLRKAYMGGGYSTTLGADTGNTRIAVFTKDDVTGSESDTLAVTVGTNNVAWAQILRVEASGPCLWSFAAEGGEDTSGDGTVSCAMTADPGMQAGDFVVGAMCIPTDVTTPSQFSAQAFTQAGVTFSGISEISEPDSTVGNDIGGMLCYASVATGSSTGAPTLSATAGGTTTNVRGPAVVLRLRAQVGIFMAPSANIPAGGEATTARLTAPSGQTFIAGRRWDDENGLDPLTFGSDDYTELAACINTQAPAAVDDYYDFYWYLDGSPITNTSVGRLTIGVAGSPGDAIGDGVTNTATVPAGSAAGAAEVTSGGITNTATAPESIATGEAQAVGDGVASTATAPEGSGTGAAQAIGDGVTSTASAPEGTAEGGASGVATGSGVTNTATAPVGSATGAAEVTSAGVTNTATAPEGSGAGAAQATGEGAASIAVPPEGTAEGGTSGVATGPGVTNTATAPAGSGTGAAQAAGDGVTNTAVAPEGSAFGGSPGNATGSGVTNTSTAPSGTASGAAQAAAAGVTVTAVPPQGSAAEQPTVVATGPGVTVVAIPPEGSAVVIATPSYASQDDMATRFSQTELQRLTDRTRTGSIDVGVLTNALLDADAQINGYLQGRYALPLTAVPTVLVSYACDIARYRLYDDRATEQVTKRYDDALRFLELVSTGRINLGLSRDQVAPASHSVQSTSAPRVFSRDSLRDFNS